VLVDTDNINTINQPIMTLLATAESGDSLMGSDGIALATTNVRQWLVASHHSKQLALLDKFEMELRLGKLFSDALQNPTDKSSHRDRRYATFRTVELLQNLVGSTRWKHAAQLMALLRGVGRELHAAGGFREPAIGNVIRRVMAAVREEVNLVDTSGEIAVADTNVMENSSFTTTPRSDTAGRLSLQSVLWALPQHVKAANRSFHRSASGRQHQRHESLASESEILEPSYATEYSYPANYYTSRPDLKQSIMEAIQEIMSDLEDLHKNINEQATNHIHSGEVILTYGRSKTVELVSS
jgi:translation initiation factor eIF-2B subunit beta